MIKSEPSWWAFHTADCMLCNVTQRNVMEWNLCWSISKCKRTYVHMYVCIPTCYCMLLKSQSCIHPVYMHLIINTFIMYSHAFATLCLKFTRSSYFTSLTQHLIWFSTMNSKHPWSFHCCGLLIHPLNLFGPCTAKAKSIGPLDADLRGVGIQLGTRQAVAGCSWLVLVFGKLKWKLK